jgi:hypothetical protein
MTSNKYTRFSLITELYERRMIKGKEAVFGLQCSFVIFSVSCCDTNDSLLLADRGILLWAEKYSQNSN